MTRLHPGCSPLVAQPANHSRAYEDAPVARTKHLRAGRHSMADPVTGTDCSFDGGSSWESDYGRPPRMTLLDSGVSRMQQGWRRSSESERKRKLKESDTTTKKDDKRGCKLVRRGYRQIPPNGLKFQNANECGRTGIGATAPSNAIQAALTRETMRNGKYTDPSDCTTCWTIVFRVNNRSNRREFLEQGSCGERLRQERGWNALNSLSMVPRSVPRRKFQRRVIGG